MKTATLDPLLAINDIVNASKQGRPTIYAAINAGHLRTMLVGRRRYATSSDVQAWLTFLREQSDAGRPVVYRPREA